MDDQEERRERERVRVRLDEERQVWRERNEYRVRPLFVGCTRLLGIVVALTVVGLIALLVLMLLV